MSFQSQGLCSVSGFCVWNISLLPPSYISAFYHPWNITPAHCPNFCWHLISTSQSCESNLTFGFTFSKSVLWPCPVKPVRTFVGISYQHQRCECDLTFVFTFWQRAIWHKAVNCKIRNTSNDTIFLSRHITVAPAQTCVGISYQHIKAVQWCFKFVFYSRHTAKKTKNCRK